MEPKDVAQHTVRIVDAVEVAIKGKRSTIEACVATLLSGGHLLIEDMPGVGKTTLAKALARALGCAFKRLQFTPDLLPSDVTGTSIFNQKTAEFEFRPGPVFAHIVLADEVNRTTPKTQSALLECMEERQVTVDGITRQLPAPFFVIATQNNVEHAGTYPLPEAQLDRFAARIAVGYPSAEDEIAILQSQRVSRTVDFVEAVMTPEQVTDVQAAVREVHVSQDLYKYVLDVVSSTRSHPALVLGASPRASLSLLHMAQSVAAMAGRDYVKPDDVKRMAVSALGHRVIVRPEHRIRGISGSQCVAESLERLPVPLEPPK